VVAVGGFDPTGGAGVVRDLLTARTLGAGVRLVPTAWTTQGTTGVRSVEPRQPAALAQAVRDALAAAPAATAVKLGMIPDVAAAGAVHEALDTFRGPVVFDPVLGASSGGALSQGDPRQLLVLAARATLVMPNAAEAERLTGEQVRDLAGAARAGQALIEAGAQAALIKGGHLQGTDAVDLLITAAGVQPFSAPRLSGPSVRGTGCALATAIAVALAGGMELPAAIAGAKAWLHQALQRPVWAGDEWHLS
jgi:hydroxymethylpyrimidine/phosphomethylpyrimidine kinase